MKKANKREMADDLWPEYDLSKLKGGVRGKYVKRFQHWSIIRKKDPKGGLSGNHIIHGWARE